MTVQLPGPSRVISKPLTVQMPCVDEVNVTGSPELAVGLVATGDCSMVEFGGLANVMVWLAWVTVKVRVIGVAGR